MEGSERCAGLQGRNAGTKKERLALQYLRLVLLARRVSFARGWWQQKLVKSIHTDPREFAIYGKYVACQTLRVP